MKKQNENTFWKIVLSSNIQQMMQQLDAMRLQMIQYAHNLKQYEVATDMKFPHEEYHKIAQELQKVNDKLRKGLTE